MLTLVSLDWTRPGDPRLPLGHASLVASLNRHAVPHNAVVYDQNRHPADPRTIARELLASSPSQLAIGVYVWNERLNLQVQAEVRRLGFEGRIILGGPQITYAGPGVEALYPHADLFIRGYAEDALVEVLRGGLPVGACVRGGDDRGLQATIDLVNLPSPWTTGAVPPSTPHVRMETSRGCNYRCSFCQHPGGMRLNPLSRARVTDEIDLFASHGVQRISVLDPIFNESPHAAMVLERLGTRGWGGELSLQCRFESFRPGLIELARPLRVQLEFGLQSIHEAEYKAVRRPNNMRRVEGTIEALHAAGLYFEVSLIYGLPNQTVESFRETLRWCREMEIPRVRAYPLVLLRGTPLLAEMDRYGLVLDQAAIPKVVSSDSFGPGDYAELERMAEQLRREEPMASK